MIRKLLALLAHWRPWRARSPKPFVVLSPIGRVFSGVQANRVAPQEDTHPRLFGAHERSEVVSSIGARLEAMRVDPLPKVPRSPLPHENKFDALIAKASARWLVPPQIIKAVIATESSFQPRAIRPEPRIGDTSLGLMQLLTRTAAGLGFTGDPDLLFDPETNVMLGTRLLAELKRRFTTWPDALAAYNGGRPRKTDAGELVPELAAYVAKVERALARFGAAPLAGGAGLLALIGVAFFLLSRGR